MISKKYLLYTVENPACSSSLNWRDVGDDFCEKVNRLFCDIFPDLPRRLIPEKRHARSKSKKRLSCFV